MTVREKASSVFLEAVTRPGLVRTWIFYCQPFLSSSELGLGVLGKQAFSMYTV